MVRKFTMMAVVGLTVVGLAGGPVQAQGIDPIQTRQTALDLLAGTFSGVNAVVAANGDVKKLENAGKAIQRFGALMPSLFPAGSDKGKTAALPEVWSDTAGFQKAAMALSSAGEALATAAKSGDVAAVTAAAKLTGEACGACHKVYKAK